MAPEPPTRRSSWLLSVRPVELAALLKLCLRIRRVQTEAAGARFLVDPVSNFGSRVLRAATYEPELTAVLSKLLNQGDIFIDVGANEGWFTVIAAKLVGPTGRVIACEPQQRLWPVLLANVALNRLPNVQVLPFALGNTFRDAQITLQPSLNSGASGVDEATGRWRRRQTVSVVPLAAVLDSLGGMPVELIKIDVEGLELEVLQGAGVHLGSTIRNIAVELHPRQLQSRGKTVADVHDFLRSKGYVLHDGQTAIWRLQRQ